MNTNYVDFIVCIKTCNLNYVDFIMWCSFCSVPTAKCNNIKKKKTFRVYINNLKHLSCYRSSHFCSSGFSSIPENG